MGGDGSRLNNFGWGDGGGMDDGAWCSWVIQGHAASSVVYAENSARTRNLAALRYFQKNFHLRKKREEMII